LDYDHPWDLDDNSFLTGMPWLVPSAGLPADVEPVTVCGAFASDVASVDIGWRWAAAAYSSFSSDSTALGVKPMDTDLASFPLTDIYSILYIHVYACKRISNLG
jgi:hypothetical protein